MWSPLVKNFSFEDSRLQKNEWPSVNGLGGLGEKKTDMCTVKKNRFIQLK